MADKVAAAAPAVDEAAEFRRLIFEAPIAELAQNQGISIDEAVKFRVDQAVAEATQVEVNVRAIEPRGKLIGLSEVKIGGLRVDDFKVFNGDDGLFLGPPSVKDPSVRGGFRRTARADGDLQAVLDSKALEGYNAAVEKLVARAAAAQLMEVKPRPIKEQMEKAAQAAEKGNAERKAPAKGKEAHDGR